MTDVVGFREVRELGAGASGRVVAAVHEASGRMVAIKFLLDELGGRPKIRAAFRGEARLLSELDSPHIVRLFEYLETEDYAAIVMELVGGCTLRDLIAQEGPTGPVAALTVLQGSLRGLSKAHEVGVVHRDFKPGNILVTPEGLSKLTDFGIALRSGDSAGVSGTPLYMAPEQWRGVPADPPTDVYAATAVFFECLTGNSPYTARTRYELALAHANAAIPAESVPEPLRPLLLRGLAKDPADRPRSAGDFLHELDEAARAGYGDDWESAGMAALGAAAGAVLAAAGMAGAAGSTGTASVSGTAGAGRTTLNVSRRGLLKSAPAKVTAGIAAAAVVGAGVFVGVRLVRSPAHHPRPLAQQKPLVPVVTVAMHTAPVRPGSGDEYVQAQYPVLTGLRDAALQRRIDLALQQPLTTLATKVAATAQGQNVSAAASRGMVTEKTTAVQAGTLLSVGYQWNAPDNLVGGGGRIMVIRLDTGAVIPENTILSPQAGTGAGAQRISDAFDARSPADLRPCLDLADGTAFASGIKALGTTRDSFLQVGVTSKGVDFWLGPGSQDCAFPAIVVPYASLTGLVDPQIAALAGTRRPL